MRSIIRQTVYLPTTAENLFDLYLNPDTHSKITGAPAVVGSASGAEFSAFGGLLSGQILETVRPGLIVQSWRSESFHDDEPDSTLILKFTNEEDQARIDLIHLDVPQHDYNGVTGGWDKYYWTPWREYLENQ